MKKKLHTILHYTQQGFTMIELIIVIGIIGVISTLVLFNNNKLNSALLLSNSAYEVGLVIREAQIQGLGVRATSNEDEDRGFNNSQGVHVDINTPNQIILFSDKDNNGQYTGSEEDVQVYTIANSRAGKILAICGITYSYQVYSVCNQSSPDFTPVVDILFKRPNPEAFFKKANTQVIVDEGYSMVAHNGTVVINIGFENDICRTIVVRKTGAVQIDTSYCVPLTGN